MWHDLHFVHDALQALGLARDKELWLQDAQCYWALAGLPSTHFHIRKSVTAATLISIMRDSFALFTLPWGPCGAQPERCACDSARSGSLDGLRQGAGSRGARTRVGGFAGVSGYAAKEDGEPAPLRSPWHALLSLGISLDGATHSTRSRA